MSAETVTNPGQKLRQQRQSRGLEIEQVASQLHLRADIVEALEQGRHDLLPAPVFAIGYMRNYARLLGLDPTPLIANYREEAPESESSAPHVSSADAPVLPPRHGTATRVFVRLVGMVVFVAIIGVLVLWWKQHADFGSDLISSFGVEQSEPDASEDETLLPAEEDTAMNDSEPVSAPVPAPTLRDTRPVAVVQDTQTDSPDQMASAPSVPDTAPATDTTGEDSGTLAAQVPATPATGTDSAVDPAASTADMAAAESSEATNEPEDTGSRIILSFSDNCWVEVRDASRRIILTGQMRTGDRKELEGTPPYRFILGKASAATITVGGKPFDIAAHTRGNVARFSIDPAQPD